MIMESKPSILVRNFADQVAPGRALDLGAGWGNNAIYLAQLGFSVTAVDKREMGLDILSTRAAEAKVKIELVAQDFRELMINPGEYSLTIAMNSLNFISRDEFQALIVRIKNGLKPGGIFIGSIFTDADPMASQLHNFYFETTDGQDFHGLEGENRYFPGPDEFRQAFDNFEIIFHKELEFEDKGHPGAPAPHHHAAARLVARKIS